jgi:hypothetical protein
MWKWFMMSCAIFSIVNWFLLPAFPMLRERFSPLTMGMAIGLSGVFVVVSLLFSNSK